MVMTGRETPELPAGVLFSDIGIMALADFATDRRLPQPGDLGRAFIPMAMPGGHLNRGRGRRPDRPSSGAATPASRPWPGHMEGWSVWTARARCTKSYVQTKAVCHRQVPTGPRAGIRRAVRPRTGPRNSGGTARAPGHVHPPARSRRARQGGPPFPGGGTTAYGLSTP